MSRPKIKQKVAPRSPMIVTVERIEAKARWFCLACLASLAVGSLVGWLARGYMIARAVIQ